MTITIAEDNISDTMRLYNHLDDDDYIVIMTMTTEKKDNDGDETSKKDENRPGAGQLADVGVQHHEGVDDDGLGWC